MKDFNYSSYNGKRVRHNSRETTFYSGNGNNANYDFKYPGHPNHNKIFKRYKSCVYCNSIEDLTIDHVIPLSKRDLYGLHRREAENHSNLVAACKPCNNKKDNKSLEDFFRENPEFRENFLNNARFVSNRILGLLGLLQE